MGGQGPGFPVPTRRKQLSSSWEEQGHKSRAMGCGGLQPLPIPLCSASIEAPGPSAILPRLTHSIKEVSELVLLKPSSQKVIWGLQDTFFEPKGVKTDGLWGSDDGHCCDNVFPSHPMLPTPEEGCVPNGRRQSPLGTHPSSAAFSLSEHFHTTVWVTHGALSSPAYTVPMSQIRRLRLSLPTPRHVASSFQSFLNLSLLPVPIALAI